MYINGHFCYADKFTFITNGLGIVRHIAFLDDDFKQKHPDIDKESDSPGEDKSIGDSYALKPVLQDFFELHPHFHPSIFLGDSKVHMEKGQYVCHCDNPCSTVKRGRTTYTYAYDNMNFRMFPCLQRDFDEWNELYKIRTAVKRAINHFKMKMFIAGRKSRDHLTTKADVLIAGIASQFTAIIAHRLSCPQHFRSLKPLIA